MLPSAGCLSVGPRPRAPQGIGQRWPVGVDRRGHDVLVAHAHPQQTDASCSAAALAVVINVLRAEAGLPALGELAVRRSVPNGRFFAATANDGPGVDLDMLRYFALHALGTLREPAAVPVVVDVVHAPSPQADDETKAMSARSFAYAVSRAAAAPTRSFVLINALQSKLMPGGANIGHFVVVAGFDAARQRALILDIDNVEPAFAAAQEAPLLRSRLSEPPPGQRARDSEFAGEDAAAPLGIAPFWLPLAKLMAAMATNDEATGETRGYLWLRTEQA